MNKVSQQMHFLFSQSRMGRFILNTIFKKRFSSALKYWEERYAQNGDSGAGSYGVAAEYKARFLNSFVSQHKISSVIDFGCGDGNQLKFFKFPSYIGLDVSSTALHRCIQYFRDDKVKSFFIYNPHSFKDDLGVFAAELVISLDIIYHLIEDEIYELYMQHLFGSSTKFVIIYAWDVDEKRNRHVRHRKFTRWVTSCFEEWQLIQTIENKSSDPICDFFVYQKKEAIQN